MTTPYEKKYPAYIVEPPADLKDGSYTCHNCKRSTMPTRKP